MDSATPSASYQSAASERRISHSRATSVASRSRDSLINHSLREENRRVRLPAPDVPPVPALPSSSIDTFGQHIANNASGTKSVGKRRVVANESRSISISSEDPDGLHVAHDARPNIIRDRARWTQSTMAMSSHYPQSSSDATVTTQSSSNPSTPTENVVINPVNAEVESIADSYQPYQLDPNDVSYRLRLLVKNNYYLPPAHTKPRIVENVTGSSPVKLSPKISTPIRDIFRRGQFKTRSPVPQPSLNPVTIPAVGSRRRANSDLLSLPVIPALPQRAVSADMAREHERKGRVVVIRERLDDEPTSDSRATMTPVPAVPSIVVDPTEIVDLPSYGFEPQASIGDVLNSTALGASALAEFVPAGNASPLVRDPQDEAWRRALLLEAVDHSMSSIPAADHSSNARSHSSLHRPSVSPVQTSPSPTIPPTKPTGYRSRPSSPKYVQQTSVPEALLPAFPHAKPKRETNGASRSVHTLPPPPRRALSSHSPSHRPQLILEASEIKKSVPWRTIKRTLSTPLLSEKLSDLEVDSPKLPSSNTKESLSSASAYSDEELDLLPDGELSRLSQVSTIITTEYRSLRASHHSHTSSAFGVPSDGLAEGRAASIYEEPDSSLSRRRLRSPLAINTKLLSTIDASDSDAQIPLPAHDRNRTRSHTISDVYSRRPATASIGNLSSPSLHPNTTSPTAHELQTRLFDSLDRTKPLTNTPSTPGGRLFSSKRSPRIPESTFELLKHGVESYQSHSDFDAENGRYWSHDQPSQQQSEGVKMFDGMLKLHIEEEKRRLHDIASSMR